MTQNLNLGDLMVAFALDKTVNSTIIRLFLYLYAKILEGNPSGSGDRNDPITELCVISNSHDIACELNISLEEYEQAKSYIVSHRLLASTALEDKRELWSIQSFENWSLASLGTHLIPAENIKEPVITVSGDINDMTILGKNKPQ